MNQIGQRRIAAVVTAASLVLVGVLFGVGPAQPAASAANGPTIAVGAPTLAGSTVRVPVRGTGAGFSPYGGFSLHVRWDPTVFKFAGADETGGALDTGSGAADCVGPNTSTYDGDGGGFILSCSFVGENSVQGEALLVTIALAVTGSGCSPIHLVTFGPPDGGDSSTGSYTIDDVDSTPQSNQYADGAAAADGTLCQPSSTHVQPALTPAPGQAGDSTTPTSLAVATAPPSARPGATSTTAASTPIAATPASGKKAASSNSTVWIIAVLVLAIVAIAGGGGYWYVRRSRAR